MAFLVQWFTLLVTTITELKLLSVNFSKLLIILVYPVEWGQTREWRMLILPGTCWPTLRGERDVAVTSLVRVYTTSELKDCGGMCIMHAYLSSMFYSGSWRMEDIGVLDVEDEVHLFCLHYAFIARIRNHLSEFVRGWNNHGMSTERNKTPMQIWVQRMFNLSNSNHRSAREFWEPRTNVSLQLLHYCWPCIVLQNYSWNINAEIILIPIYDVPIIL